MCRHKWKVYTQRDKDTPYGDIQWRACKKCGRLELRDHPDKYEYVKPRWHTRLKTLADHAYDIQSLVFITRDQKEQIKEISEQLKEIQSQLAGMSE